VQNAYTLAFGGLLLLGARAGDLLGRRRMFIAGLIVFTVASLAVGVAQDPGWLIAARVVQGAGAAILAPSTLALLTVGFPAGPELFRNRVRAGAYAGRLLFLGAMMGFWFFTTQYLQTVLGFSPLTAGVAFLPMTVINFAVAIATPRLTRRFGNGPLLAAGIAVTMAGCSGSAACRPTPPT
jgi:MFS family permease